MATTPIVTQNCDPRIIDVSNSCDGSLSKATIKGMTPGEIERLSDLGFGETAFVWRQMAMGNMAGVREDPLLDLLISRVKGVSGERGTSSLGPNRSFFLPYFLRLQEDIVNSSAFSIVPGSGAPAAGGHAGARTIRVRNSGWNVGPTSPPPNLSPPPYITDITRLDRHFLIGEGVIILNLGSGLEAQAPVMKVVRKIDTSAAAGVPEAEITLEPYFTSAFWASNVAGGGDPVLEALHEPDSGVVMVGTNTTSDYESYCENQPVDMSKRVKIYWPQTSRFTRCWDDEYQKLNDKIFAGEVNTYLEMFKELPLAEQNKRQQAAYNRKWRNTMFYGVPIDENQTEEGYRNLPHVVDPRTGQLIEYKTQAEGMRTQIAKCGRVLDYEGAQLNFNFLEEQLYQLKRHREANGSLSIDTIDVLTDRGTANRIKGLMSRYYQLKHGAQAHVHFGPKDPIRVAAGGVVLWERQEYEFDEAHVMLNVMVENSMSDHKLHFPVSDRHRGNNMWFIDWTDIEIAVSVTNSRKSTTPDLESDPDFKCVIAANKTHYIMESVTATPVVGDETRHLIIENFSDACPDYDVEVCEPTQV